MPYLAIRHFSIIPKGTQKVIDYKPGDYVLDFLSWSSDAQRVHLNQKLVERTDVAPDPDQAPPKPQKAPKPKPPEKQSAARDPEAVLA